MTRKIKRSPKDLLALTYVFIALSPVYYFMAIMFSFPFFLYTENVSLLMAFPLTLMPSAILLTGLIMARKSALVSSFLMLVPGLTFLLITILFYWTIMSIPIRGDTASTLGIFWFAIPRGLFAVFPFLFTGSLYFAIWIMELRVGNPVWS